MFAPSGEDADQARALFVSGNYRESAALYTKLLAKDPKNPRLLGDTALMACVLGDFSGAASLWRDALSETPDDLAAQRSLSALLLRQGHPRESLGYAEQALTQCTQSPSLCALLARIHAALGNHSAALECASLSRSLEPRALLEAETLVNAGDSQGAIALLEEALRGGSESLLCWKLLGWASRMEGRTLEACAALRQAQALDPTCGEVLFQLGLTLSMMGRQDEACCCFRSAIALNPENAEAQFRLGLTLLESQRFEEALEALRKASALRTNWAPPLALAGGALWEAGRWEEGLKALRRAVELEPGNAAIRSQLLLALYHAPSAELGEYSLEASRYGALLDAMPPAKSSPPQANESSGPRRLRIGYVSGDFRRHSAAFFIEPLLEFRDRAAFEVFCYMTRPEQDAVTLRLRPLADHWIAAHRLTDDSLAEKIRADRIDVLIDLSNHSANNRLPVFARRPAKVQLTMIGLHQTTGVSAVDYRVSDRWIDPPEHPLAFHSETVLRLESGPLVFKPPREAPEPQKLPSLSGRDFVLACTSELRKTSGGVCELWARILQELPSAKLMFFATPGNHFAARMEALGIPAQRLIQEPRRPLEEFLKLHGRIDLALDPFPCNGLTANLMSAWMGVPSIALNGTRPQGRTGAAVLHRLGLSECVAHSQADYLKIVCELAGDLQRLASIRDGLRARVRMHFGDAPRHVRELEQTLQTILEQRRRA
jgi:predicted O-linked N-acetylglucosamine transferase (SPINDLY family)